MISVNKGDLKVEGSGLEILTDITFVVGFMARQMCTDIPSLDYEEALQSVIAPIYESLIKAPFPTTNKGTEGK